MLERLVGLQLPVSLARHVQEAVHEPGTLAPELRSTKLIETFGPISYTDLGVNGATCLTFTHPQRIAAITALKPELLILSFGTNESHNRSYNANTHYQQMDELIGLFGYLFGWSKYLGRHRNDLCLVLRRDSFASCCSAR